jgi:putative phage-type endonuclease
VNPTFHHVEQRTAEWDALRRGKLTASSASKLVTPTGKLSTQYKGEIARIVAERMGLQEPEFIHPTYWMERGINLEEEASNWFQVETGLDVEPIGFVEDEDGFVGASPDGIIRDNIPLELKCPKPSTHIQWLLDGCVPKEHIAQVHFQMALCEAPYAYFSSYNPEVAPLIVKVEWSDYTDTMVKAIKVYKAAFIDAINTIKGERDAQI